MATRTSTHHWRCCACCAGIALDDHVGHGGIIETDQHEGPCDPCGQGSVGRVSVPAGIER